MLKLGTHHPDFTYPNDARQAKLALFLTLCAAIFCVLLVLTVVA